MVASIKRERDFVHASSWLVFVLYVNYSLQQRCVNFGKRLFGPFVTNIGDVMACYSIFFFFLLMQPHGFSLITI